MRTNIHLALLCLLATAALAQTPQPTLAPTGEPGAYTGFDILIADEMLAEVRFCSNDIITAARLSRPADDRGALVFEGLQARPDCGAQLAPGGRVVVRPGPKSDPFPRLEFAISLAAFDSAKWEQALGGPCPFHFLTLSLKNAEAIHHRGFLVATPKLDPYTMQVGRQGIVASKWSRDWTWAPPFGACPIPVAGLWAPGDRRYVALDFMEPRLSDHSEKFIASSYCWEQAESRNFIALVVPYAKKYVELAYPEPPISITSHCRILYDLDLPYWKDPNQWYHARLWRQYRDQLPGAPTMNDLSWLPANGRGWDWPGVGGTSLTYTVPKSDGWESIFFEEGVIIPREAPGWVVDVYYRRGMRDHIANVKRQFDYLIPLLKRFEVNDEQCCYWEKPLEGRGKPKFAGDVTTLRHIHGWGIADVMLAMHEHAPNPEYLDIVEGVLNWTKYNICTRNDISDVPEAMFTIGWGGVRLCLRYHRLFRSDPERAERAKMALELAHALAYRYTTLFMPDNAEDDNLDGTYLIEPNSGRPWTGMPCANECCAIPDALLRVYVKTGDPILLAYIRGMVERWPLLYQEEDCESTATSETPFSECWGLFDGCAIGARDRRAKYGALGGFNLIKPVGHAMARVVCGEKGAACFTRRGRHTDIRDYRAGGPLGARSPYSRGLSFRIVSRLEKDFEIDVTVPNYDLTGVGVMRRRNNKTVWLQAGKDYLIPEHSLWDIAIHKVRDGDIIALQSWNPQAPTLDIQPVKSVGKSRDFSSQGFSIVDLSAACNWKPNLDWDVNDSYAPYTPGNRYAWGVPFFLVPAYLNEGKAGVTDAEVKINAGTFALFLSEVGEDTRVHLTYAGGEVVSVMPRDTIVAWKAWPKWFPAEIVMVPHRCPGGEVLASVSVSNAVLWAVTTATDESGAEKIAAVLDKIRQDRRLAAEEKRRQEEREAKLKIGHALVLTVGAPQTSDHCYAYMYFRKGEWTIPPGTFLEYDVMIPYDSVRTSAGVDLTGGTLGNLRDRVSGTHPAGALRIRGEWLHRKLDISGIAGETFEFPVVATDGHSAAGHFRAYFRDIAISDGKGKVLISLYANGPDLPAGQQGIAANGNLKEMQNPRVAIVPAANVDFGSLQGALELEDGVARDDFSVYAGGSNGMPTWSTVSGMWGVSDGAFVGTNCGTKGWIAQGAAGGDMAWKDYRLGLRFRILEQGSDWRDGAWIGFRARNNQRSAYSLNFHSRNIELHKHYLGRRTTDSNPLAALDWTPDNERHKVVITVVGAEIKVTLDGKQIMDVIDENALGVPPIPAGNIVLCARQWKGSEGRTSVAFDDVEVRLIEGP